MTTFRRGAAAALMLAGLGLGPAAHARTDEDKAEHAADVLRKHCVQCHGGPSPKADLAVLNFDLLQKRKLVRPGDPDGSELWQLVECGTMPPGNRPKLLPAERQNLADWIKAGAKPPTAGDVYVLRKIAQDVQSLGDEARKNCRYVSFHHLQGDPDAPNPEECRDALLAALNLLTWKREPVRVAAVDPPADTVFRIDLRDLGWDEQPYRILKGEKDFDPSPVNLYDLVLLEYPFAPVLDGLDGDLKPLGDYLKAAGPVRPVVFVRGDWLVVRALQPPLYADLLQLPRKLPALEAKLGAKSEAVRGGFSDSATAHRNRLAERRETSQGALWRTYEIGPSKDKADLLRDADVSERPGLALFTLPNGLFGCFVADLTAVGEKDGKVVREARLADAAPADWVTTPAEWVTEPKAPDHVARLGLSCLRCHAHGVKPFNDAVGPALDGLPAARKAALQPLYPGPDKLKALLDKDREDYDKAVAKAVGHPPTGEREPLGRVADYFAKHAGDAPADPGAAVILPIDALSQPSFPAGAAAPPVPAEFRSLRVLVQPGKDPETEGASEFHPKVDFLRVDVTNPSKDKPLYFELIGAKLDGRRAVHVPVTRLDAGKTFHYPPDLIPDKKFLNMNLPAGTEQYILYASDKEFDGGVVLVRPKVARTDPSDHPVVTPFERVVHPFYALAPDRKSVVVRFDPARLVKRTIDVTTLEK
jgi:serine/threonine-protein kinase